MKFTCDIAALLVTVLLISAGFFGTACAAQQDSARDYYLAGSGGEANRLLRNVERHHWGPALKALQARNYRTAQAELAFILRYFPNHPQALAKMAEVGVAIKRPDLAEQRFQDAISQYPERGETYVVYGAFLHKLGQVDAAIAQYQKALGLDPSSPYAHYNLGLAYVDRTNYSQANVHAQKAYELGAPFPGLKKKLQDAGAWKPSERASSSPAASPSSGKQEGERKPE